MSWQRTRWVILAMALMVGAPMVKLLGQQGAFLVWPKAIYSDLLTAHLPLSVFIHQALVRWWQVPLWNPIMLGGQPLIGDPLAGLSYPPLWLTYLWPSASAFQALFAIHLIWAGIGSFLLGRRFGLRPLAAAAMAVAFAGTPRLWGHWGLGHVTLTLAVCWTPWVLLALESAIAASVDQVDWLRFGVAGAALGVVASADPRWAAPAGLLALLYFAWRIAYSHQETGVRVRRIGGFALMGIGALGASAWLLLPLLEFASQSTRAGLSSADLGRISLEPAALLGAVVPDPAAWPEQVVSVGIVVLLLACVGVVARSHPSAVYWAGVAVVGWLLGLGPTTPVYRLLEAVPGMSLLRVPSRWVMLSSFSFSVLAGIGVDAILPGEIVLGWQRRGRLLLTGFLSFLGLLVAAVAVSIGPFILIQHPSWLVALIWAALAGALMALRLSRARSGGVVTMMILLVPLELSVYNWQAVEAREMPVAIQNEADSLVEQWGDSRLLSTAYSLSQLSAVQRRVELAGGVGPLQLERYWTFMADSLGFDSIDYSVTLPPYPLGDPMVPGELALPAERLGWLNITEVVVPHATHINGFQPIGPWHGGWLYANQLARPRAWVQDSADLEIAEAWREVDSFAWQPSRIEVLASGPGRLVLAENAYPGWIATIDGDRVEIDPAASLLRSVALPAGEHRVVFQFIPWEAILGLVVTALTGLALLVMWWKR
ncbi:MAG: hypothetical protein WBR18_14000 [Anaerolineales bacterium]